MKKIISAVLAVAVLLSLCACGQTEETAQEKDIRMVSAGKLMTVEVPDGFVLNESNDALSFSGIYYFTFTSGEGKELTNDEGKEALIYDCQIYLLVAECGGLEYALSTIEEWKDLEGKNYEAEETTLTGKDGSVYECFMLTPNKEDSPFNAGAAAFIARDNLAISAEIYCCESYRGDIAKVLQQVIDSIVFIEQEN